MSANKPAIKSPSITGQKTIGLGILSWRGAASLDNALSTYKRHDLFSLFDDNLIFLPEPDNAVMSVAKTYAPRIETVDKNLGILRGMEELANRLKSDYILLTENDCPCVVTRPEADAQIQKALELLDDPKVIMARMRSVTTPGETFDTLDKYGRYFGKGVGPLLRRTLRPSKARRLTGSAVYAHDMLDMTPDQRHPRYIELAGDGFYLVNACTMPWTNQSILMHRDVFLNTVVPVVKSAPKGRLINGFRNVEIELNNSHFWTRSGWKIACGPGIFTHKRVENRGY